MNHYEIVFLVHPYQNEQVTGIIRRFSLHFEAVHVRATANTVVVTGLRITSQLKRNALVSSSRVSWPHSIFIST